MSRPTLEGWAEACAADWVASAACGPDNAELFFPTDTRRPNYWDEARTICWRDCPVRTQCLTAALERREEDGMWGGLTPEERQRVLRREAVA